MVDHPALTHVVRGKVQGALRGAEADRAIAWLAEQQHDVVGRAQLLGLGVSGRAIDLRLANMRLRRIYRGVYAVGRSELSNDGWCMAAVLLAGEGSAISHRTAGAHVGVLRWRPARADVTVARERRQLGPIQLHYGAIAPDELTVVRGVPCTGISRTLFDLAAVLSPSAVGSAMKEAEVLRLTDEVTLQELVERYPHKPGVGVVRDLIAGGAVVPLRTRSDLEIAFLEFLRVRGLPLPETNVWVRIGQLWIEVDCLWRDRKLIAELDGKQAHLTTHAFEKDRERDRALLVSEWRSIRVTWRMLHHGARELEADLRVLLSRAAA